MASSTLIDFLKKYCEQEQVEKIIIGDPKTWTVRIRIPLCPYKK